MPSVSSIYWPSVQTQQTQAPSSSSSACQCARLYNLQCEQGETLSSKITITLDSAPVNITGNEFQFTAKLDPSDADDDPYTVTVDWQETSTPTQGTTWLKVPAAVTQSMQVVGYPYQIRMVSSSGVVTPVARGVLTIVQPVSSRF